ncbi:hypothetical protein [Mesorhizobium sp. M0129]|uniref:ImmA/IrrE family metallo-endopeptidase n=1 Tax=Mesorhizobium sp. M0129 TaxID=2956886 RepID=UPI00333CD9C8
MATDNEKLVDKLREAGISRAAIEAAWPTWWTEEINESPSGRAELRFALARRLGLDPKPLLGERVEFVWNDEARFKHLSTEDAAERSALTSYGISLGRLLLHATPDPGEALNATPEELREAILAGAPYVDLRSLLTTCWALGIPVIHLRVFPLETKAMHAMVVAVDGRFAILLGRDASYPAPVAFTLAHELGHIFRRHLGDAPALIDLKDPATAQDGDEQEDEADAYALTLLTGSPKPDIETNVDKFNAPSLASAVLNAGPLYNIEPGTLALCLAFQREAWPIANAALRFIYTEPKPVWREVNGIAESEIGWDQLSDEAAQYLRNVMTGR